ncbi:expressed protein [Phakopsora pachyrhizi]|uniref:Expressed protein n=1 Tax=Phakopsora pachyrhizi TaxID=170000 RepID=A0AAV0AIN6_PHAPC|nr:expressed protein [Phakopsora pachyrhizi]
MSVAANPILNVHKRRRSDGSLDLSSSSPTQAHSHSNGGIESNSSSKAVNPPSELRPTERTMSSSNSTVSNTSHYGFNPTDSARSTNQTPASNAPASDSANHLPASNGAGGTEASGTSGGSPRSSPGDCNHLSLDSLPKPKLAMDTDQGFLFEWWTIFWDVFRAKTGRGSAPAQPAQLYAQTVAAASIGMSADGGGITKSRRDALGILALPSPLDLQKGHLNERIQQQYTLLNPNIYGSHPTDLTPAGPVRLSPHHQLHPKHALLAEHTARQHHLQRLQHQQQLQQQHQQAAIARQRMQQRQQEAQLHQQVFQQHQSPQMHQVYPEPYAAQRQISVNGRRPGVMNNVPQEQLNGLVPHPPAQHGSPLNPHPQPFRASRPPSRSGATHAPSPFGTANHLQSHPLPPREPSRGSNQANSPANQNNPRTPSLSQPSSNLQAAVLPANRRGSPTPTTSADEQDRKKRRLNEQTSPSNSGLRQEQFALQSQLALFCKRLHFYKEFKQTQSPVQSSPIYNVHPGQKAVASPSPTKDIESSMPPPAVARSHSQTSTPQAVGAFNKPSDSQLSFQPSNMSFLPNSQANTPDTDKESSIFVAETGSGGEKSDSTKAGEAGAQSEGKGKDENIWQAGSACSNQKMSTNGGHNGVSNPSPPALATAPSQPTSSEDLPAINSDSMEHLFSTDGVAFDLDATLFEAFINFDQSTGKFLLTIDLSLQKFPLSNA